MCGQLSCLSHLLNTCMLGENSPVPFAGHDWQVENNCPVRPEPIGSSQPFPTEQQHSFFVSSIARAFSHEPVVFCIAAKHVDFLISA